ncbi:MAG: PAS domain S-box protein [Caulobacter sp.]|nr:PAS domain S-box protein [Caulobacter sp.]
MTGPQTGKRPGKRRGRISAGARWFFDNSLDMFAVVNREGIFTDVNDAWERLTGWRREDLLGRTIFEFTHEDCFEEARDSRRRMKRDGHTVNQLKIRRKDGAWMWIEGRSRLDPNGDMVGTLHDITESKLHKEELDAARRIQSMLAEAAGIGTWRYEPLEERIDWSDDSLALFGWDPEAINSPEKFFTYLDPAEIEAVSEAFSSGVATGVGGTIEHRLRTSDGSWLTMRATFRTEPRGSVFALMGISQDVTALVEARDAAREGERRVQALMEQARMDAWRQELALSAAAAGAFEIDHAAQTFWGSDQFHQIVGRRMTYEEMAAPVWVNAHEGDRDHILDATSRWTAGAENLSIEFRVMLPEGGERWLRASYRLDVATRKGVGLVQDIDVRKRQELVLVEAQRAAQAAAEAKARFLANMSHEIRTPMNGVIGVLHLLKGETLSVDGNDLLDEALSCGAMLSTLLDDVIDFERIEAGRLELADEPLDAGALARSVIRLLEPQARKKGLGLTLDGAEDLGWVRSDPVRLRQCLFNLVGNAVKFTIEGGVTLRCARSAPGQLTFTIEDTGVGIPLEAQGQLFERFHQADASTTRRFGGSGLGLAITRTLAEMMGGGVDFDSTPGVGSTFRLLIGAAEAAAAAPVAERGGAPLDGLRILIVEDNATNRTIAVKMLESLGASAGTAHDGASGVEAAQREAFDLILMDIQMPGMDGLEASRQIRALSGRAATTPIIALTANVLSHQRDAYLAAGMNGVVGKPISPAALLAEVARFAGGGEADPALETHVA